MDTRNNTQIDYETYRTAVATISGIEITAILNEQLQGLYANGIPVDFAVRAMESRVTPLRWKKTRWKG